MRLRSIEGPSFAGKSTLANYLAQAYEGIYIREYMDYANAEGCPGRPLAPTSIEEAKAGFDFFLDIERRRTADIRRGLASGCLVVSDRTVLSLVAYQLALDRQGGRLPGRHIAVPDYALEQTQHAVEQGDVEMPDRLIVLSVANEATHQERVARRGATAMGVFNHWCFSVELSRATEEAAASLLDTDTEVLSLPSYNGEAAFTNMITAATEFFALPVIQYKEDLVQ